jgi:hypothetical protein
MASPFPGMDPYLEQHWGDVHHRFITYACDHLQPQLPSGLRARVEERVFVDSSWGREWSIVPDIRVTERHRKRRRDAAPAGTLTAAEPLILELDEEATQGYIEIRDAASGNRVVTSIELLSPANKVAGEGQDKYLQKQRELRAGRVSSVEIDLLRSGHRLLPIPVESLPAEYRTPYQVWIRRGWQPRTVAIYRVPLQERLPIIHIPLRQADTAVTLDLQAVIDQCYANGGYQEDLDYQVAPVPPLDPPLARWAQALLVQHGLRHGRRTSARRDRPRKT